MREELERIQKELEEMKQEHQASTKVAENDNGMGGK